MAGWRQEFTEIQVDPGACCVLDINSVDDTAYVSLNGLLVGSVGLRGQSTLNKNLSTCLRTGENVLVVSVYNDNKQGDTGQEDSPARLDGSLTVGPNRLNLSYATPGDHIPGLVYQHAFLIKKV